MKKNKMLLIVALCICLSTLLTGCSLKKEKNETPVEEVSKGNCKILECINKIEITDTLEIINNTIGFEGTQTSEGDGWTKYKWELNDNDNVEVTIYSSGKNSIKINFKDEKIKNSKVDFSGFAELKKSISDGTEVKYEQMKATFKGEGTLIVNLPGTTTF